MKNYEIFISFPTRFRILFGFEFLDCNAIPKKQECEWSFCFGLIFIELVIRKYKAVKY